MKFLDPQANAELVVEDMSDEVKQIAMEVYLHYGLV